MCLVNPTWVQRTSENYDSLKKHTKKTVRSHFSTSSGNWFITTESRSTLIPDMCQKTLRKKIDSDQSFLHVGCKWDCKLLFLAISRQLPVVSYYTCANV